jgi:hypothetical protein
MPSDPPMHIYPDPDDGGGDNYAPSNIPLDAASLASGAIAVGVAVAGSGSGSPIEAFLFQYGPDAVREGGFLFFGGASPVYVAAFTFFASLSVVLGTINLLLGLRMKKRLHQLSRQIYQLCEKTGLIKAA